LDNVLPRLQAWKNPRVLVGFETADDAGVYKLTEDCALIQTVDFFTPIVDDPYTYGAIAAANALSDVYAMGGKPVSSLSIVGFPDQNGPELLLEILQGGADKMKEAACSVVGGHSVSDAELKFGYAVTGVVHPKRFWRNVGARPGDTLLLSKPIGTGVIATAAKRGGATSSDIAASIASMLELNRAAAEALDGLKVHACTDVTGFGLLGHLKELCSDGEITAVINTSSVPLLSGALAYSREKAHSGGLKNNREFASCVVEYRAQIDPDLDALLYDPQTSGGLLVAIDSKDSPEAMIRHRGFHRVGQVIAREEKAIRLVNS
jgi:selenide,water dikinase